MRKNKFPHELDFGRQLETYFTKRGLKEADKFDYKSFTVYLADGGPFYDKNPDFPYGWFESVYAILYRNAETSNKQCFFQPLCFEINHDSQLTSNARTRARINAARKAAHEHINELLRQWHGLASPNPTLIQ